MAAATASLDVLGYLPSPADLSGNRGAADLLGGELLAYGAASSVAVVEVRRCSARRAPRCCAPHHALTCDRIALRPPRQGQLRVPRRLRRVSARAPHPASPLPRCAPRRCRACKSRACCTAATAARASPPCSGARAWGGRSSRLVRCMRRACCGQPGHAAAAGEQPSACPPRARRPAAAGTPSATGATCAPLAKSGAPHAGRMGLMRAPHAAVGCACSAAALPRAHRRGPMGVLAGSRPATAPARWCCGTS